MDKQIKSVFIFENYIVNKIDFDLNSDFNYSKSIDLDFSIDINIALAESPLAGKVTLNTHVFNKAHQEDYPFSLFVSLTGSFSVTDESMTKEQFIKFCQLNGAAALFPFLRSIIADITKVANFPSLILPLINVHNLIDSQNKEKA